MGGPGKCQRTADAGQMMKKVWASNSPFAVTSSASRIRTSSSALITMTAAPKSDGAGLRVETGGGGAGGSPAIAEQSDAAVVYRCGSSRRRRASFLLSTRRVLR